MHVHVHVTDITLVALINPTDTVKVVQALSHCHIRIYIYIYTPSETHKYIYIYIITVVNLYIYTCDNHWQPAHTHVSSVTHIRLSHLLDLRPQQNPALSSRCRTLMIKMSIKHQKIIIFYRISRQIVVLFDLRSLLRTRAAWGRGRGRGRTTNKRVTVTSTGSESGPNDMTSTSCVPRLTSRCV